MARDVPFCCVGTFGHWKCKLLFIKVKSRELYPECNFLYEYLSIRMWYSGTPPCTVTSQKSWSTVRCSGNLICVEIACSPHAHIDSRSWSRSSISNPCRADCSPVPGKDMGKHLDLAPSHFDIAYLQISHFSRRSYPERLTVSTEASRVKCLAQGHNII